MRGCDVRLAAAERERGANEKAQNATGRQAALVAALEAAREEASVARHEADAAGQALLDAQGQLRRLEDQLKQVQPAPSIPACPSHGGAVLIKATRLVPEPVTYMVNRCTVQPHTYLHFCLPQPY